MASQDGLSDREEGYGSKKTIRFQKVKKMFRRRNLLQEEDRKTSRLCGNKEQSDDDDYPPGDVLEFLELALAERLKSQEAAIKNWYKIGFRIKIIQAFKMLERMNEGVEDKESRPFRFVMDRNSKSIMYWNILSTCFLTISFFVVPYCIAFDRPYEQGDESLRRIALTIDIVLLIDICIQFITDNYSEPGQVLTNRQVANRYLKGYFLIDVLAVLPCFILLENVRGNDLIYKTKLLRYLQLPRTFSVIEKLLSKNIAERRQHVLQNSITVIKTLFKFLLVFHVFACMWIILG